MYVIHFTGELFIRDSVDYYVISTLPAGEQGFEPRSATLKAAVLPLNHSPWIPFIITGHVLIVMVLSFRHDWCYTKGIYEVIMD